MKVKLDLGKDSIFTIFINYAIPSVLGMLAMSTAGIIDGIFIGRYVGTNALAAVNLVYPIAALALGISIMIGVGGSTVATTAIRWSMPSPGFPSSTWRTAITARPPGPGFAPCDAMPTLTTRARSRTTTFYR